MNINIYIYTYVYVDFCLNTCLYFNIRTCVYIYKLKKNIYIHLNKHM